jgi:hypothetical protein
VGNVTFPKTIPIKGIAGSPTTLTRESEKTAARKLQWLMKNFHAIDENTKLNSHLSGAKWDGGKNPPAGTP